MKIFVIIPTYNESLNIEKTIKCLLSLENDLGDHNYNILVTDANSPDKTAEIVNKIRQTHKNVYLLIESKKLGIGKAYIQGMDKCFNEYKANVVITFDADMSHDYKKIPLFIKKIEEGFAQVNGTRYKAGGGIPKNWGIHRKILSIASNLMISTIFFEFKLTDFTSGYKALTKEVFYKIKSKISKHDGYTFSISLNLESLAKGVKIAEVPYYFKDREFGTSKIGFEYLVNGLKYVIRMRTKLMLKYRFIKVFIAGGLGGVSQLLSYALVFRFLIEEIFHASLPQDVIFDGFTFYPRLMIGQLLSMEVGIFVSFYINNKWAFSEKTLSGLLFIRRYVKNHFVVAGAIVIQLLIVQILSNIIGRSSILDIIYQVIGILVGLIWNYYFYKKIIWKSK